jgi:hypothetical protein
VVVTPEQDLAEAKALYETEKPVGWRAFSMGGIKVANRVPWYSQQIRRAYPFEEFETAERMFYGDLKTVLAYVNAGHDPNLVADVRQTFRSLCRQAKGVADRIHQSDPEDLQRRLTIFGLNRINHS